MTFEISHLAEECLGDAYERVVPIVRRVVGLGGPQLPVNQVERLRKKGARIC